MKLNTSLFTIQINGITHSVNCLKYHSRNGWVSPSISKVVVNWFSSIAFVLMLAEIAQLSKLLLRSMALLKSNKNSFSNSSKGRLQTLLVFALETKTRCKLRTARHSFSRAIFLF